MHPIVMAHNRSMFPSVHCLYVFIKVRSLTVLQHVIYIISDCESYQPASSCSGEHQRNMSVPMLTSRPGETAEVGSDTVLCPSGADESFSVCTDRPHGSF